ncbi:tryptophan aminotransferase-related protein 2 isoform X1 [Ziziphus jujuba]|uniref:Tryptophan aminotransferase-related protein 2 isoform X1 n=1 Tax=Ziziphus jujuba TaxID=326968 RepID=A0A6P4A9T5_ZIZJJ|nr:tryptophan aminotransferase-related protein 2 isoform X1 [Ziziphus jujuba]
MAKITTIFSLKNLFVLSVALNVSLILKVFYQSEKQVPVGVSTEEQKASLTADSGYQKEADVNQKTIQSLSTSSSSATISLAEIEDGGERIINLDHGDPTMYEKYWKQMGERTTIVIPGWQSMSYFSDVKNLCWFLEPEFGKQVVRLHKVVGNAETDGRHIVVGTGSSQLYLAALFALSPANASQPMSVVSAAPYYSSYPSMTDCLKSGLYKWAGDARSFNQDSPYIELVTSPNNPDGFVRHSMVNKTGGTLIHDLAYYWPQYTPISSPADNDLTLFTVSKTTGHAGTRIGWALVKDPQVARKMTKFIELNTIGVSKDSQLRAAKVLKVVADSCEKTRTSSSSEYNESFFQFSYRVMDQRWQQLREVVNSSSVFSLPDFPPDFCHYHGQVLEPRPAFAWLKCERELQDCESFLRGHKLLTRGGRHFGVEPKHVRISMLDRDDNFRLFLKRLSMVQP